MRRFCYVRKIRKSLCLARLPESRQQLIQPTPENLRIRKRILSHDQRMKATHKKG